MNENNRITTLVNFSFLTGDDKYPVYDVLTVICGDENAVFVVEDALSSYLESGDEEDDTYEQTVINVLSASGIEYQLIQNNIPACDRWKFIRV